jgi:Ran GTPase-activating protein (RanGAP) involved in mRNA processing and transport
LSTYSLWDTGLSPEGASALASLLCGKNSFKELNLSGDKITNAGVSALAGALTVNQSLEKIE